MRKYPVDRYLIPADTSVRDALQRIEETERRTVFTVDEAGHLAGSVTDGDIRRWLLGGGEFTAGVANVANDHPLSVFPDFDQAELRGRMLEMGAMCVPQVDAAGCVVDMIFWEDIVLEHAESPSRPQIDVPVVIMAGGRGTRMAPFTQVLPKPLLPVGESTVIELIIERFQEYGIHDFTLTVNFKANLLRAYFQDPPRPYEVGFVEEPEPLGTAGSLSLLGREFATPVILTNCDIVIQADYHDLVRHHESHANAITMVVSMKNYNIPYGVCEIENGGELRQMKEKPSFDFLVNTGMYVLSPAVLEQVAPGQHCDMNHLLDKVQAAGGRVGVYPIGEGSWLDTGEWAEYKRTLQHFENALVGRQP